MNPNDFNDHDEFDELPDEGPSKSCIKREMTALQKMGVQLTELNAGQLATVPISDNLRTAIALAKTIKKHEGLRRQMQYIGKLMRYEDAEAIRQRLDEFDASTKASAQALHHIENWRSRLLGKDHQQALTELIADYPQCEVQTLRQLIRKAQQDVSTQKNTGAARKLFQFLRELIDTESE